MKISFCISTLFNNTKVPGVIDSIHKLNIPTSDYEVLLIGPKKEVDIPNINYIHFDDKAKRGLWVTRKKNILANEAKFDNLVICNDYFIFDPEFYTNWVKFGEDWDVASNAQKFVTGERVFHDWCTLDHPNHPCWTMVHYDDWTQTKYQYQAGGYVVAKKKTMLEYPFNEKLLWGQAEDVEWSKRIRDKCKWVCNGLSIVKHNKNHHTYNQRHNRKVPVANNE